MQLNKLKRPMAFDGNNDDKGSDPDAEIQAQIQAAVDEATKGLKNKNSELLGTLKTQQAALKAWEGLDPEKVRGLMTRLETDEDAKLIAEGKVNEALERRVAKRDADWQKKLDALAAERDAEKVKNQKFMGRVLDDQLRAAVNGKVHDKAVEDALFRGRTMFALDENGNAVQLQDGQVVMGKDGKTPFSPAEWIDSMRESAPHWFPATGGGSGAQGSQAGGGSGKQITRAQFDSLNSQEKAATIKAGTKVID